MPHGLKTLKLFWKLSGLLTKHILSVTEFNKNKPNVQQNIFNVAYKIQLIANKSVTVFECTHDINTYHTSAYTTANLKLILGLFTFHNVVYISTNDSTNSASNPNYYKD